MAKILIIHFACLEISDLATCSFQKCLHFMANRFDSLINDVQCVFRCEQDCLVQHQVTQMSTEQACAFIAVSKIIHVCTLLNVSENLSDQALPPFHILKDCQKKYGDSHIENRSTGKSNLTNSNLGGIIIHRSFKWHVSTYF